MPEIIKEVVVNGCNLTNCTHNRSGSCLDPVLKDPYRQTGCLYYTGINFQDYPKSETDCKFCIDRWFCQYKENGFCQRDAP